MLLNVLPPLLLTSHCTVAVGLAGGRRGEGDAAAQRLPFGWTVAW